jgi:polyferredoxin
VDACDEVMFKIGRPAGLIAFDTEANVQRRLKGEKPKLRFLRPRTVLYALVILLVSGIMLASLATRHTLDLGVMRDRNPDFVTLADGAVRNGYTVNVMNRTDKSRPLLLDITGLATRDVKIIGLGTVHLPAAVPVESDKVRGLRVLITAPRAALTGHEQKLTFTITDPESHESHSAQAVFISGGQS